MLTNRYASADNLDKLTSSRTAGYHLGGQQGQQTAANAGDYSMTNGHSNNQVTYSRVMLWSQLVAVFLT